MGNIGVASLAIAVVVSENVSPGIPSSTKNGTRNPESSVVLYPYERSNELRGISAFGTSEKRCPVLDVV